MNNYRCLDCNEEFFFDDDLYPDDFALCPSCGSADCAWIEREEDD
jgi:DNA-directed RNA polymerase subunit RPC12/RpoP